MPKRLCRVAATAVILVLMLGTIGFWLYCAFTTSLLNHDWRFYVTMAPFMALILGCLAVALSLAAVLAWRAADFIYCCITGEE